MAVDLILTRNGLVLQWPDWTYLRLEDDPVYWFLSSGMIEEVKQQTGEWIDLYGHAEFSGEKLEKLARIVAKTLEEIRRAEESEWPVHLGTQWSPVKKEWYGRVTRAELVDRLEQLLHLSSLAIRRKEKIITLGN
jgi:hypothetical protein